MTKTGNTNWDQGEFSKKKRISKEDKQTIAEYYRAGLKTGKSSDDLLEELAERYGKSDRTIQRYIRKVTKPQEVTGKKTEVESEVAPLPTQVTREDDREHLLSTDAESMADTAQEESRAHTAPPDNQASESPKIKDEHFEQDKKPPIDTSTQSGPTIAEENKRELVPR